MQRKQEGGGRVEGGGEEEGEEVEKKGEEEGEQLFLTLLMLCAPTNRRGPFYVSYENDGLRVFHVLSVFSWKTKQKKQTNKQTNKQIGINSEKCIEYGKWRQSDG